MTSVGSWIVGSGTVSTRTSRLPCHVTAFMQARLPQHATRKPRRGARAVLAILPDVGFADFALSQLPDTPSRLLEVGCGGGQVALALAARGHDVTAIDPVAPDGPIFRRVTIEEYVPSDRFDAVLAGRSLHHVGDLDGALDKIAELAPLLIVEEFAWNRMDERTATWYLAHRDGSSTPLERCLREW